MTEIASPATTRTGTLLVTLLVVSIFVNYIDRSNLSLAAPAIQQQLRFSEVQMGGLLGAFFWTYSTLQVLGVSGWVSDRYPVGWVLAGGFLVWTSATLATAFFSGYHALFAVRLLLGAGESLAYPCYSRILATEVPQQRRGVANALLDAGSKLGPGLGTLVGGLLLVRYGWRVFFVALGCGGLLWLVPWLRFMPRGVAPGSTAAQATAASQTTIAQTTTAPREAGPKLWDMLSERSVLGAFAGHFCANYFWFFLLIWLPSYLVKQRGLSTLQMTRISAAAYCVVAAGTLCAGWASDRLIRGGSSVTRVRKTVVVSGLLASATVVLVGYMPDLHRAVVCLLISCVAFGTYTSNHWAITQTLAGASMAGRWTGMQNGIGNYSGIAAASFTGFLVQKTGSFQMAFVTAALVAIVAAGMWGFVVGPVEEVAWPDRRMGELHAVT